ncbi:MAG: hypothetical protein NVSMB56_03730 [Pyrinomonadaceae bacterium]
MIDRRNEDQNSPLSFWEILKKECSVLHDERCGHVPDWTFTAADLLQPDDIFSKIREKGTRSRKQAADDQISNKLRNALPKNNGNDISQLLVALNSALEDAEFCKDSIGDVKLSLLTMRLLSARIPQIIQLGLKLPEDLSEKEKDVARGEISCEVKSTEFTREQFRMLNRLILEDYFQSEIKKIGDPLEKINEFHATTKSTAICFSGGGIRSATFNLGILQGLAKRKLLGEFDYLSTVSGGGYIGSWLAAWIYRERKAKLNNAETALTTVQNALKNSKYEKKKTKADQPNITWSKDTEPYQVSYLRSYSNYLNPQSGLFSADTWTLVAIYFRNLILNWMVLIPLLLVVIFLPRLCILFMSLRQSSILFMNSQQPNMIGYARFIPWLFYTGLFFGMVAIGYVLANRPSLSDVSWLKRQWRGERAFLICCLLPLLLSAFLLTSAWAWLHEDTNLFRLSLCFECIGSSWQAFVTGGILMTVGGFVLSFPLVWTPFERVEKKRDYNLVPILWRRRWEFVDMLLAGALLGFAVWLLPEHVFNNPEIKYQDTNVNWGVLLYACFAMPLLLLVFLLVAAICVGLVSDRTTDEDREWWARAGGWVLIFIVGWSFISALVVFGPIALTHGLFQPGKDYKKIASILTIIGSILSGIITLAGGYSGQTLAVQQEPHGSEKKKFLAVGFDYILKLAALIFTSFIFVVLSLATNLIIVHSFIGVNNAESSVVNWVKSQPPKKEEEEAVKSLEKIFYYPSRISSIGAYAAVNVGTLLKSQDASHTSSKNAVKPAKPHSFNPDLLYVGMAKAFYEVPGGFVLLLAILIVLFGVGMGYFVNVNRFSLHGAYRDRLIRAYLGASQKEIDKQPNPFTNMDDHDNLQMCDLRGQKPMPVVNITLNLTRSRNLAWQERKAESFTISPWHAGSANLGYRSTSDYAYTSALDTSITLGTALAVSGAAISPNMGYYSSPGVTFLLALFNLRLGWWLGNPGVAGNDTYNKPSPRIASRPLLDETFGRTDDDNPYVYLSDGGHFENLGLYEMVRRRCRLIIVCDAGADPSFTFSDLGKAVRKIRVDLGVNIDFGADVPIHPRIFSEELNKERVNKYEYFDVAEIKYSERDGTKEQDDGVLIYIKPTYYGRESADIRQYATASKTFPHETTSDQFYTESQFESYRALGECIVADVLSKICGKSEQPLNRQQLWENARRRILTQATVLPAFHDNCNVR